MGPPTKPVRFTMTPAVCRGQLAPSHRVSWHPPVHIPPDPRTGRPRSQLVMVDRKTAAISVRALALGLPNPRRQRDQALGPPWPWGTAAREVLTVGVVAEP